MSHTHDDDGNVRAWLVLAAIIALLFWLLFSDNVVAPVHAQTPWTLGYTKGQYVRAGRSIIGGMDRSQLASLMPNQCFGASTWTTIIASMEDDGVEYPDTVYFQLAWVMDSVFYARADTTVVPWASDLYGQVYLARGHTPLDSLSRTRAMDAYARRRKTRPSAKP